MSATATQSVFEGSGAGSKVGLEIWRIENLLPVRVESSEFGNFYSGDCYLVLNTYKKSERSNKLDADLHYWQGESSSQDERGASAYRTVELDDFLNGVPVQHREVQGHESKLFLSYFPKGIQLLEGGVDTAFRHVDANAYQPRLFHCKGKRNVTARQVELKASSLNEGDVFILDAGLTLYQWNGVTANRNEKHKGLEIATKIKDAERGGKAKLVFIESSDSGADSDAFFKILGGSKADVKKDSEGGSDDAVATAPASLWRVSDASGKMEVSEVGRGKLEKSMLDENDVFLLDTSSEIFVWIGRGATKDERNKGMSYGADYLASNNRPSWTPLTRLPGGGETPAFKSCFRLWDLEPKAGEPEYVAKERKMELGVLLEKQKKAEEKLLDNGTGKLQVWRIENLKKVALEPKDYGQFSSGDSYIVLYYYKNGNRDSYVLFFWQGRDSTTDEKTASALLSVELAAEIGPELPGTQVRVVQNKEPAQFLALFKGKMVVHKGGVSGSGGYASKDGSASSSGGNQLFHIRGTNPVDTRAVEVTAEAASLNSSDCFVLLADSHAYAWNGKGANETERQTAASLSKNILAGSRAVATVEEGQESDEFWTALGGKAAYADSKALQVQPVEPRLFQISGITGNFTTEELFNWSQDDLAQNEVFLLDTVAEVYVWLGNNARKDEKEAAMLMAQEYVKRAPDGRDPSTPVFRVLAGAEPPTFTAQFIGWSGDKATDFEDPYKKKLAALAASSGSAPAPVAAVNLKPAAVAPAAAAPAPAAAAAAPAAAAAAPAASSGPAPGGKTYTLAELKAGTPAGVEPSKKENYLSDAEFKSALGVDREAFAKFAGWKQADIKKKAGIF